MDPTKTEPETLQLRARPRAVTRLSRRMLIAIVTALVATVFALTWWSLQRSVRLPSVPTELHNVDRVNRAEGLDQLPQDYSNVAQPKPEDALAQPSVPVLGDPLPGDLGMAMLRAQQNNAVPGLGRSAAPDPARIERTAREREADDAAKAPLFFHTGTRKVAEATALAASAAAPAAESSSPARVADTASGDPSTQSHKLAFVNRTSIDDSLSHHTMQQPVSPYQVMAGTIISAALITGINSDLPGTILASVTEPVYDSKLGRYLLIPQGTRLIGEYDSQVAFGQRRVLLAWNRLIFPDASSLTLDRLPGVDTAGNAGLEDSADRHWRQLLAGAALSSLIGVAAELAAPDRSNGAGQVIVSARQSVQDSINQAGQALTRRNVDMQPTVTIRPGYPLRVIVSKDLVLHPYQPLFVQQPES